MKAVEHPAAALTPSGVPEAGTQSCAVLSESLAAWGLVGKTRKPAVCAMSEVQ